MLTLWDSVQQIIRILLYVATGWLVQRGILDESTATALAGALLGLATGLWTFWWNRRQVVTVAAASDPASPVSASAALEIKAAKDG